MKGFQYRIRLNPLVCSRCEYKHFQEWWNGSTAYFSYIYDENNKVVCFKCAKSDIYFEDICDSRLWKKILKKLKSLFLTHHL